MNGNLLTVKTAIVAFFTALGAFLGWKGVMLLAWVLVMALDYLTGTLAACHVGEWSSSVAREGIWHRGGMIAVVAVAAISDWDYGTGRGVDPYRHPVARNHYAAGAGMVHHYRTRLHP